MARPSMSNFVWHSGDTLNLLTIHILTLVLESSTPTYITYLALAPNSLQWAAGFTTFWYPGGSKSSRASLHPWHVYFGVFIYALAVATTLTGILEKLTFLQANHVISRYSTEALLMNSLGMLVMVLGGFVVLALVNSVNGKGDIPR